MKCLSWVEHFQCSPSSSSSLSVTNWNYIFYYCSTVLYPAIPFFLSNICRSTAQQWSHLLLNVETYIGVYVLLLLRLYIMRWLPFWRSIFIFMELWSILIKIVCMKIKEKSCENENSLSETMVTHCDICYMYC